MRPGEDSSPKRHIRRMDAITCSWIGSIHLAVLISRLPNNAVNTTRTQNDWHGFLPFSPAVLKRAGIKVIEGDGSMHFLTVRLQKSDSFHIGLIIAENLKSFLDALPLKSGPVQLVLSVHCATPWQ